MINDFKCVLLKISLPGLLLALGTVDAFLLHYAFNSVMAHGPSVQLVFGLEVLTRVPSIVLYCLPMYVLWVTKFYSDGVCAFLKSGFH